MTRIGLLSDTHSYLDPTLEELFADCDEIWHAGDIGDWQVMDTLQSWKPVRAVWGNIDTLDVRHKLLEDQVFMVDDVKVYITHIGGYPGRYNPRARKRIEEIRPDLFICGHSHILKVMPDEKHQLLHINPGACGKHGFHRMRTAIRFALSEGKVEQLEVIELGLRGALG